MNEEKAFTWGYYPPSRFKILLYYPETGEFAVSGIYERYAFDTYYSVDMQGIEIGSVEYDEDLSSDKRLVAHKAYEYSLEIGNLVARIVVTVVLEMIIALLFGFRKKNQFIILLVVNVATQLILNVLLNIINYMSGGFAFVAFYILCELLVVLIEAVIYCAVLKKKSDKPKPAWFYVLYSLVANVFSFAGGLVISMVIPGIF